MIAHEAIKIINEAFKKCLDEGWRFKGHLEAVNPLNQKVSITLINFQTGKISNQEGTVEIFNMDAILGLVKPYSLAKTDAALVLEANDPTITKISNSGEVCKTCGCVEFRRMGTCLYCVNCGESTGCS